MSASIRLHVSGLRCGHPRPGHMRGVTTAQGVVPVCLWRRQHALCCHPKSKDTLRQSFDSEDELDSELAQELRAVADPQRLKKLAKHFELAWKISRPGRPQTCDCCKGRKEEECHWCHGTGYLMVGNQVYPSTPTHTHNCPVCQGKGHIKCERCRGTGFRANWLPADSDLLP